MPKPIAILAALVSASLCASVAGAVAAEQRPPKKRADLVVKSVSATYAAGAVSATAKVKNKGTKMAKRTHTEIFLVPDTQKPSPLYLGSLSTPRLKPGQSVTVTGSLPYELFPGRYRVWACADFEMEVKEHSESDCRTSPDLITVPVTITAVAGPGGTVAASAVSGGSCAGAKCTFPPGTGTVTFTPSASVGMEFAAWTGTSCVGYTSGTNNSITFTDRNSSAECTATFRALRPVPVT